MIIKGEISPEIEAHLAAACAPPMLLYLWGTKTMKRSPPFLLLEAVTEAELGLVTLWGVYGRWVVLQVHRRCSHARIFSISCSFRSLVSKGRVSLCYNRELKNDCFG